MPVRHGPGATKHRSSAWRSGAETEAPALAESATRLKQAQPDAGEAELEQDIQASLSAALDDLDNLELFLSEPAPPKRSRALKVKVPRGMPPLPHGRVIPPLPVSRLSLVPRLVESVRARRSVAPARQPVALAAQPTPVAQAAHQPSVVAAQGRRRWPGVVLALALLALCLLGAGWWWLRLR